MYDVKFLKVLDEELQEELLKDYIETSDSKIRELLILHNLRLVKSISKRYYVRDNPLRDEEDLFNEGVIGLMNSLETYDPEKGSFSHHAATHIRASIGAYVRDKGQGLRVSAGVYETLYKIESFRREYVKQNNRKEPTIRDISEALDIPYKKVEFLVSIEQNVSSLDIQISEDGEGTSLGDMIEDPESDFEDDVCGSVFVEEFMIAAAEYLNNEELEILRLNLGLDCRENQMTEVARMMDISYGRIQMLKKQALRKLRKSDYVLKLNRELDDITIWYRSPRYDTERVQGGNKDSPVERIAMRRERDLRRLLLNDEE